jgi:hypothetical protein
LHRFKKMARNWHELAAMRDFLTTLRSLEVDPAIEIEGHNREEEWLIWTEDWPRRDPTAVGDEGVFQAVGAILALSRLISNRQPIWTRLKPAISQRRNA